MTTTLSITAVLYCIVLTVSCSGSAKFKGHTSSNATVAPNQEQQEAQEGEAIQESQDGLAGRTPAESPVVVTDSVTPTAKVEASANSAMECVPDDPHVRFITLFDASTSMNPYIDDLAGSIIKTNEKIKNLVLEGSSEPLSDVKAELIAFTDLPSEPEFIPLTSSDATIKASIRSYQSKTKSSNKDGPEYGLKAFTGALDSFVGAGKSDESILIILMITDDYAHNGGIETHRNYSLDSLATRFASQDLQHLFIYDVTPEESRFTDPRNPWASSKISAQWDAIRQLWQTAYSKVARSPGRSLGFPTSNSKLEELFVDVVAKDLSKTLRVCP